MELGGTDKAGVGGRVVRRQRAYVQENQNRVSMSVVEETNGWCEGNDWFTGMGDPVHCAESAWGRTWKWFNHPISNTAAGSTVQAGNGFSYHMDDCIVDGSVSSAHTSSIFQIVSSPRLFSRTGRAKTGVRI